MSKSNPIEKTVIFATNVETLQEAWAFIMDHMEEVGGRPRIQINPRTYADAHTLIGDTTKWHEEFEVCISGTEQSVKDGKS